jgi:hypothetical protein
MAMTTPITRTAIISGFERIGFTGLPWFAEKKRRVGARPFAFCAVIPGRALARTRNLEIPGLVLRTITE